MEYAIEAVKLGSTVVGIQTKQGSILAIEKRLTSTLLEPSSVEKVMEVDSHIGAAVSGLIGDARTLVDHARIEAQNHRFTFDEVRTCEKAPTIMAETHRYILNAFLFRSPWVWRP